MTRLVLIACLLLTPPLVLLSDMVLDGVHGRQPFVMPLSVTPRPDNAQEAVLPEAMRDTLSTQ
jgi:hypothetical protein